MSRQYRSFTRKKGNRVGGRGSRPSHPSRQRNKNRQSHPGYREPAYLRAKAAMREDPNPLCEVGGPKCTKFADNLDHIQPLTEGGTNDAWNLRYSCSACNQHLRMTKQLRRKLEGPQESNEDLPFYVLPDA